MSSADITGAGITHTERALDFLLLHMGQETRQRMMAELPATYAALFPGVATDVIVSAVRRSLECRK